MRTIGDVLTWLEGQEGDDALTALKAIKDHQSQILQSRASANQRLEALQGTMMTTAEAFGVKAEDAEQAIKNLSAKATDYQRRLSQLKSEEEAIAAEKAALEAAQTASARAETVRKVAEKAGANFDVFSKLISDDLEFDLTGDDVKVGDLDIKDWAEKNHASFVPALFPVQKNVTLPRFQQKGADTPPGVSAIGLATGRKNNDMSWLPNIRK